MVLDCINFNRLATEAAKMKLEKRNRLTEARAAFFSYELKDSTFSKIDMEKNQLTKFCSTPHWCKFLKENFYNNKEGLIKDPLFNKYVKLVIQQLKSFDIDFKKYFENLLRYASPFKNDSNEYDTMKQIANKKELEERDIEQFMLLILKRAVLNLYRSDSVIIEEATNLQRGLKLTNPLRIEYLNLCVDLGSKDAMFDLGGLYYEGINVDSGIDTKGIPADPVKSFIYWEMSNCAPALWSIGWMFQLGLIEKKKKEVSVPIERKPDYESAISYYLKCTTDQFLYAKAFNSLGILSIRAEQDESIPFHKIRIGNLNHLETAEFYFKKGLALGDCHSGENLGNLFLEKAKKTDSIKIQQEYYWNAFRYFSFSAECGMVNSMTRVAEFYLYEYCPEIKKDLQKAEELFRNAISIGGSAWARFHLAKLLLEEKAFYSEDIETIKKEGIALLKESLLYDNNQNAKLMLAKFL